MRCLIFVGFLAGTLVATDEQAAREWFLMIAKENGMSDKGAEGLLKIMEKIDTGFSSENMPTVEQLDQVVERLRPQIIEQAVAMMCKKDGPRVASVLDVVHQKAREFIQSQQTE